MSYNLSDLNEIKIQNREHKISKHETGYIIKLKVDSLGKFL